MNTYRQITEKLDAMTGALVPVMEDLVAHAHENAVDSVKENSSLGFDKAFTDELFMLADAHANDDVLKVVRAWGI